jgi:hypothetical protein
MSRFDNVTIYFMMITQVRDQIASIGEKMDHVDLVNVALNGLPKSQEPFFKGFSGKNSHIGRGFGMIASRKRLGRIPTTDKKRSSDENLALVSKTRKGKGNISNKKDNIDKGSSESGKKELSKIQCFSCHKNGHYASQCLKKKGKGKTQTIASLETQLDEFAAKFEKDFSLVSYLSTSTTTRSVWYLDNGASHHMTESWELFSSLMERDSIVHVELGDNVRYAVKGEGIVSFQLESRGLFDVHDVLYVPGMKKNFLSVLTMEGHYFSERKSTHTSPEIYPGHSSGCWG